MRPQFIFQDQKEALELYPDWLQEDIYFDLLKKIRWKQQYIFMFGKRIPEPRLIAWFGKEYTYSGLQQKAKPLTPELKTICDRLIRLTGLRFNSVLLNFYADGSQYMGWHKDNESEMDTSIIASISLGASRPMHLRTDSGEKIKIELPPCSLLLMHHMQERWQHTLPKRLRVKKGRINLTFRRIVEND